MPTSTRRLAILAFDAADKDLILDWAAAGYLPTFRRLLDEAAHGVCESPIGLYSGALWSTFATAVSPAVHARYCWRQFVPGTYEVRRVYASDIQAPPFWQTLSEHGRRVAVIDLPKSRPIENLNGIQIVDWGMHDPDYRQVATWPESLGADVVARYGTDTIGNCNPYVVDGARLAELRAGLLARIARKTDLILDFLARERWDFFAASFADAHCAGHQFWHVHDATHAKHDPALRAQLGDPVRDIYEALDAALARILAAVPPDLDLIVLASHGFRPHYGVNFLLDEMLWRIERPWHGPSTRVGRLAARVAAHLPGRVRTLLGDRDPTVPPRIPSRAERRYFAVPNNDIDGAVRLNLVGREPSGRVAPDAYRATCDAVAAALQEFVDEATGAPMVVRVNHSHDLYRGPNLHHLPDLLVEWNDARPVTQVSSPRAGRVAGEKKRTRTGDHRSEGMFFVRGAGLRRGPIDRRVSIMDFGPTIAEWLGVPLDTSEGRSFADALVAPERGA